MNSEVDGDVLLVGDGDFSFTRSLLNYCSPCQITTTNIETEESILKHKNATTNRVMLEKQGVNVFLGVDACDLQSSLPSNKSYQRIIFNFPHAGGKSNHKKNRKLLNDFFCSAVTVLQSKGEVMVTLCKGQGGTPADRPRRAWSDSWQVVSMAANAGLILTEIHPFNPRDYPGYFCTGFRSQDKWFHIDGALTHVFTVAELVTVPALSDVLNFSEVISQHISIKINRNILEEPGHPLYKLKEKIIHRFMTVHSVRVIPPEDIKIRTVDCLTAVIERSSTLFPEDILFTYGAVCSEHCVQFGIIPVQHNIAGLFVIHPGRSVEERVNNLLKELREEFAQVIPVRGGSVKFILESTLEETASSGSNLSHKILILRGQYKVTDIGQVYLNRESGSYVTFTLCLDKLLCTLCDIEDQRLLWSRDKRFLSQFKGVEDVCAVTFKPFSLYPLTFYHDMSFWENPDGHFNEERYFSIIRDLAGDCISDVSLLDVYTDETKALVSRCYRLTFQSCDQVLSYQTSWNLQSVIRLAVAQKMKITLR